MTKDKGRPGYYLSPTHDFTQYTKDSEEKHWDRETAFDWSQNVQCNLEKHLDNLDPDKFSKTLMMSLPIILEAAERKIESIRQHRLPIDEDALKDISECLPGNKTIIDQAISAQGPLKNIRLSVSKLTDRLEILNGDILDLQQQHRLGFYKNGHKVKVLESDEERKEQISRLDSLRSRYRDTQLELSRLESAHKAESELIKPKIRLELDRMEADVLRDLEEARKLLQRTLQSGQSLSSDDLSKVKNLILKRQLRALKDIANHALVVEQSAIAPLTMGIIHYRRHREIQEAMTTFINDEAKHSTTFRRFLVEKLNAKEFISSILIKGAARYMWIARFMPGTGIFLAVIVEAIGAAYLEFFGNEEYMPENLFCSISKTISNQDEVRHMNLCVGIYNELYRKGSKWEHVRNRFVLNMMMKGVYGDKNDDHHLIQAFRVFGVESETLYKHLMSRLSHQLSRVSLYVTPEELLGFIGRK